MTRNIAITLRRTFAAAVLTAALVAMVTPGFAAAQASSATQDQYAPVVQQHHGGTPGGSGLSGRVGPLPFTGFDVLAMAGVALAVTGLGLGLQRAVARRPHEDVGDSARL